MLLNHSSRIGGLADITQVLEHAAGIGEGDLVITTPFSFVASSNVMLFENAIPLFVDVDPKTGNIDTELVKDAIENTEKYLPRVGAQHAAPLRSRLKAILPVDVFGQPANMDEIMALAKEHNLTVIEDSCEALGAEYKGKPAGMLGDFGVFAFYPNKQMTTGEGGMIITDDDTWNELFRSLRNQGRDKAGTWLNHVDLGYNYRMDELSAALGVAQMERLPELLEKRAQVARWYATRLQEIEGVEAPQPAPYTTRMSWFVYVVRLAPEYDREQIIKALAAKGVPARPYFKPIHLQPYYVQRFGYRPGMLPTTEAISQRTLALPFFGKMTKDQIDYVCDALAEVLHQYA